MRHRADVEYVQKRHPETAEFLAEMIREFGREQLNYRVVIRR